MSRIVSTQRLNFGSDLSGIGSLHHQSRGQLALHRKIERLNIRGAQRKIGKHAANWKREKRAIIARVSGSLSTAELTGGHSGWWCQMDGPERIFHPAAESKAKASKWRILLGQRISVDAFKEHAVASADTGLAIPENIPCKTKTRSKVIVIVSSQSSRKVSGKQDTDRRVGDCSGLTSGNHGVDAVVPLFPRQERFPADSISQGEPGSDLEFILEENRVGISHCVCVSDTEIQIEAVERPQHEISHWVTRSRARKAKAW